MDKKLFDNIISDGIEIKPCTEKETAELQSRMGPDAGKIEKAYRVIDKDAAKRFEAYCREHGLNPQCRQNQERHKQIPQRAFLSGLM